MSPANSRPLMARANQSDKLNIGLVTAPMTPIATAKEAPNPTAIARVSRSAEPSTINPGPPSMTIVVPTNSAATNRPNC